MGRSAVPTNGLEASVGFYKLLASHQQRGVHDSLRRFLPDGAPDAGYESVPSSMAAKDRVSRGGPCGARTPLRIGTDKKGETWHKHLEKTA